MLEAEYGDAPPTYSAYATDGGARVPQGGKKAPVVDPDPSLPERWNPEMLPLFPIHLTKTRPWLDAVAVRGLVEWRRDAGDIKGDDGKERLDSSHLRRARLGMALRTYYGMELKVDALFDGSGDYEGIESLEAHLPVGERSALRLGKFPPPFSLEYTQDAAVRWVPELSPLVAQMVPASSLGILFESRYGRHWDWKLGWFSSDADPDLPAIDGSGYVLVGLGYSDNTVQQGEGGFNAPVYQRWHLDYIYNPDLSSSESVPFGYRHLLASGIQVSSGRCDVMGDVLLAHGEETSAWGVSLLGAYWLADDALRLVGRFHYANSDDEGGVLSGWGVPRSGAEVLQPYGYPVSRAGAQLYSLYSGLNVHLYEDSLILSAGLEFRSLEDEAGESLESFIWQTGGRLAF